MPVYIMILVRSVQPIPCTVPSSGDRTLPYILNSSSTILSLISMVSSGNTRNQLPAEGKRLRDESACEVLWISLQALGLPWFTRKSHTNWLEKQQRKREKGARTAYTTEQVKIWLRDNPDPSLSVIGQWANALNVDVKWLFGLIVDLVQDNSQPSALAQEAAMMGMHDNAWVHSTSYAMMLQ
ncbi:hypothetical protein DAEQUDRAFT_35022 [Daedalea quercina L-15889]|uniref:Uncharacterized protein n=1 Tax=Daedalea quercina L-15889 TaxID=1314783 RepID=A0A165SSE0_9APHY|nr:hypothetical protein DAEQUDRAFT_35022 [Daedalea quercina L-15889]